MNLEKMIEWVAIVLVVILGARWMASLFGTADPVGGMRSGYTPYLTPMNPGAASYLGYPYGSGVVVMAPGIVGRNYPQRRRR